jgi:CitMHS family citrate-Mg2+:H+ or citrate-Ca2+:H+ symporter
MNATILGFIMIAIIVVILIKGKVSIAPVFVILPLISAALLGYGISEINGFISNGLRSVLNTAALFAFAVMYFSFLNDVGMFDVIVKKVMKYMSNKVEIVLLMAAIVATISHLDGSGATTMLITIPTMLPIFKKMKIRPQALLLMAALASGAMNVTPWCSSVLRLTSAVGLDPQEMWLYVLPLQVLALLLTYASVIVVGRAERKNGAGMTDEEFAEMKKTIDEPAVISVSQRVLVFDMVLTAVLIGLLLSGKVTSNLGFMVAFAIALVVNYPNVKQQNAKIREYGGAALNMIVIIFSIGILVGVTSGTGMIEGMANTLVAVIPESLGGHLPFVMSVFSVPISMVLGSDTVYLVLAPIMGNIVMAYGGTMISISAALLMGAALSANLTLIGPTPYLALGLADVEMGSHLKYSFKYVWAIGIIVSIFAGILNIIPF